MPFNEGDHIPTWCTRGERSGFYESFQLTYDDDALDDLNLRSMLDLLNFRSIAVFLTELLPNGIEVSIHVS